MNRDHTLSLLNRVLSFVIYFVSHKAYWLQLRILGATGIAHALGPKRYMQGALELTLNTVLINLQQGIK